MALIDDVKPRIGVFYSEANKDKEVQGMIDSATAYFKGAGWDVSTPTPLAIEAIVVFCKMAQSTDPSQLVNHPVLISYIVQGRAVVADV